jgi:predicted  nucleic acid-binding Zn-ribbon protein
MNGVGVSLSIGAMIVAAVGLVVTLANIFGFDRIGPTAGLLRDLEEERALTARLRAKILSDDEEFIRLRDEVEQSRDVIESLRREVDGLRHELESERKLRVRLNGMLMEAQARITAAEQEHFGRLRAMRDKLQSIRINAGVMLEDLPEEVRNA